MNKKSNIKKSQENVKYFNYYINGKYMGIRLVNMDKIFPYSKVA